MQDWDQEAPFPALQKNSGKSAILEGARVAISLMPIRDKLLFGVQEKGTQGNHCSLKL